MKKLDAIERNTLLAAKNVLTMDDLVLLTELSKSHLYKLTCRQEIPFYRKGKYLYFDRKEIEDWMKSCRSDSNEEAMQRAAAYILRKEV